MSETKIEYRDGNITVTTTSPSPFTAVSDLQKAVDRLRKEGIIEPLPE